MNALQCIGFKSEFHIMNANLKMTSVRKQKGKAGNSRILSFEFQARLFSFTFLIYYSSMSSTTLCSFNILLIFIDDLSKWRIDNLWKRWILYISIFQILNTLKYDTMSSGTYSTIPSHHSSHTRDYNYL